MKPSTIFIAFTILLAVAIGLIFASRDAVKPSCCMAVKGVHYEPLPNGDAKFVSHHNENGAAFTPTWHQTTEKWPVKELHCEVKSNQAVTVNKPHTAIDIGSLAEGERCTIQVTQLHGGVIEQWLAGPDQTLDWAGGAMPIIPDGVSLVAFYRDERGRIVGASFVQTENENWGALECNTLVECKAKNGKAVPDAR